MEMVATLRKQKVTEEMDIREKGGEDSEKQKNSERQRESSDSRK